MDASTLLPPIIALALALLTRQVVLSLAVGIALSETLIASGQVFLAFPASVDRTVKVLTSPSNAAILAFCLLIGALLALMRSSGGIAAAVQGLIASGAASTPRRASLATALAGVLLFIETNISLLASGIIGRPLFDRLGMSRERLAYIIDSTCSPVSVLILLNGWGAYALALVLPYVGAKGAPSIVAGSIPFNFYALATLALVFFTSWSGKAFGPLARAKSKSQSAEDDAAPTNAAYMIVPMLILVGGTLSFMVWTGGGNMLAGDGARSVLLAGVLALLALILMLTLRKHGPRVAVGEASFGGVGDLVPATFIILLALALGDSLRSLGTGTYLAGLATDFPVQSALPALIFLVTAGTSFAIGTSWGTYGILIPVAMPLAIGAEIPPSLMLAAVLGGGVFGDHASPISDTTVIASLAAGCDHIEHVRTQLPYALGAALIASCGYLLAGILAL